MKKIISNYKNIQFEKLKLKKQQSSTYQNKRDLIKNEKVNEDYGEIDEEEREEGEIDSKSVRSYFR